MRRATNCKQKVETTEQQKLQASQETFTISEFAAIALPAEQDKSSIRQFLARSRLWFRRRVKVVAKAAEMVDLALRIYHRPHDKLDSVVEKIPIFRSVFG